MPDSSARHYMKYAYDAMQCGGNPCSFAGKTVAHVFKDSSDDLRSDVLALIAAVDAYLPTYTPRPATAYQSDVADIRFWLDTERTYYMQQVAR